LISKDITDTKHNYIVIAILLLQFSTTSEHFKISLLQMIASELSDGKWGKELPLSP